MDLSCRTHRPTRSAGALKNYNAWPMQTNGISDPQRWVLAMTISSTPFQWSARQPFANDFATAEEEADLVLVFASGGLADAWGEPLKSVNARYPRAEIVGCSSAGEILSDAVSDESLVGLALRFEHTTHRVATVAAVSDSSTAAAHSLADQLAADDLKYVLVLSDGIAVNGSDVAAAMRQSLGAGVIVTGGLAGDEARFEKTSVFVGEQVLDKTIVAVGFYGDRLRVGYGSLGGWDPFGPERTVTRSKGNVLLELDNESALDLYRKYLGPYAEGLPASGLKFPLSVRATPDSPELVRTLLAIDDDTKSMTFAGDIPEGSRARLMRANFDRLVDGSEQAASMSVTALGDTVPQLGLLISCVGRKLVLGERIEEEVEAVREVIGERAAMLGFYSYGELSPVANGGCELHNQTMTITTLAEV